MVSKTFTAALVGLDCQIIEVEVDYRQGLNHFVIVGLGDKSVQEAKERIVSAIRNSGAEYIPKRVIVNLAPADIPKTGPAYDLAIAVGFMLSTEQLNVDTAHKLFLGELALDGNLRPISGVLPIVDGAKKLGFQQVFLPAANAAEAAIVSGLEIFPVNSLPDLINHFRGQQLIDPHQRQQFVSAPTDFSFDLKFVKGQLHAKRALEIAAAGGHNLLFSGVPGSGKTLLAKCLPSILPQMTEAEQIEVTKIFSVVGHLSRNAPLLARRPFRSPHHTASSVALVGGGSNPRPGEISLAHLGVLFLDELPEFSLNAIEALRQPLEDKVVTISRATKSITFPADFMLVAAMNPCKCGHLGDPNKACECSPKDIKRYLSKLSGPILDRIDLVVKVTKVDFSDLQLKHGPTTSSEIRAKVQQAKDIQNERYISAKYTSNSNLSIENMEKLINIDSSALALAQQAMQKLNLSMRAYYRSLKVARTIADLAAEKVVNSDHVLEALSYRQSSLSS